MSGGERKRVTVAEMLVGPRRIMFMGEPPGLCVACALLVPRTPHSASHRSRRGAPADEISTGLDSATLFSIVKQMSEITHAFKLTSMVSLLQPPPEVYYLFDDLCLLSDG